MVDLHVLHRALQVKTHTGGVGVDTKQAVDLVVLGNAVGLGGNLPLAVVAGGQSQRAVVVDDIPDGILTGVGTGIQGQTAGVGAGLVAQVHDAVAIIPEMLMLGVGRQIAALQIVVGEHDAAAGHLAAPLDGPHVVLGQAGGILHGEVLKAVGGT